MADISDTAIPFQAGARNEQRPGPDSFRRSKKVEHELQEAALADRAPAKRKHLQQSEVQRLASKVLGVGQESGGDQGFVEKLGTLLRSAGIANSGRPSFGVCCSSQSKQARRGRSVVQLDYKPCSILHSTSNSFLFVQASSFPASLLSTSL